MNRTRVGACALIGVLLMTLPEFAQAPDDAALSVRAGASAASVRLDGLFDEPAEIVSFTKQRDGSLRNEDNIKIYNHNVRQLADRWQLDSNQLLVKLQYALRY